MNSIQLIGRLVKDPDMKMTQSGKEMVNITLAVKRDYKTGDDYVTDFINCTAFGTAANYVNKYVHKGEWLAVNGSLQINPLKQSNGETKYYTNVLIRNAQGFNSGQNNGNQAQDEFMNVDQNFNGDGLPFS